MANRRELILLNQPDGSYAISLCEPAPRKLVLQYLLPTSLLAWCIPVGIGVSMLHHRSAFENYFFLALVVAFVAVWNVGFGAFFFMNKLAKIVPETKTLCTKTSVFGIGVRTRVHTIGNGNEIGISTSGLSSDWEHTVYCYNGRRRWRFLCVPCDSSDEHPQLIGLVKEIARLTGAQYLGYGKPDRLIV